MTHLAIFLSAVREIGFRQRQAEGVMQAVPFEQRGYRQCLWLELAEYSWRLVGEEDHADHERHLSHWPPQAALWDSKADDSPLKTLLAGVVL